MSGASVWLASEDTGAILLREGKFEPFDRASGLPSSWTVDVAPARGGGAWVATLRDGAVRVGPDGTVRERLAPGAWGLRLYGDGGRMLFGTQQGIAGWDLPLPDRRVHAMLRTADGLFIGTEVGLIRENRVEPQRGRIFGADVAGPPPLWDVSADFAPASERRVK